MIGAGTLGVTQRWCFIGTEFQFYKIRWLVVKVFNAVLISLVRSADFIFCVFSSF